MGIKFRCPNGHKLNVKSFLAGKKGICPHCGVSVRIPSDAASVVDDQEAETDLQTGGTATATLAKAMADTVTLPTTVAVAEAPAAAPLIKPIVAATPVSVQPVSVAPVASAAPLVPVAVAAPVTPVVPVATAAPISTPIGAPVSAAPVGAPLAPSPYAMMPAAPVDPIAEAPNAVWYVRPPSGGQFGPARGDIMRKWLGEGRVSADSLVWRDGWQDWKSAVVVFPSLAPAGGPAVGAASEGMLLSPAAAATSPSRALRAKKRSNGLAIAMVITLGLISLILLAVFIYVLSGMNQ